MATTLETQKRLASRILDCGTSRIWIDPEAVKEISTAMTAGDIRKYIGLGFIRERQIIGNSRGRNKDRKAQVKKGRRHGFGSRKGASGARAPTKEHWIKQIRAQRKLLQGLRTDAVINNGQFRKFYSTLKAGNIKSKAHLLTFLKEQGVSFSKKEGKKQKTVKNK